jgi:hypothetical protein
LNLFDAFPSRKTATRYTGFVYAIWEITSELVNVAMLFLNEATLIIPIVAPFQFWKMDANMLGACGSLITYAWLSKIGRVPYLAL